MTRTSNRLVLVGGGGHAKVVIDAAQKTGAFEICGITDVSLKAGTKILDITVLGGDDKLAELFQSGVKNAFISIGSIGDSGPREKIYEKLKKIGFQLPVITHPDAVVAKDVIFGEGTFLAAGAIVNPGVHVGKNVILNTSSSIDHDCEIGDFVHIAPGAVLSGGVKVGNYTHIGTGASVIQSIKIGSRCLIGAGTTVRYDVSDNRKHFEHAASYDQKE